LATTVTLYDLTNSHFEGTAAANPSARLGRSKQKRSDCPLVTLGLVLDGSGFVRRSKMFAGNVAEASTLQEMLKDLAAPSGALVIMDAGIAELLVLVVTASMVLSPVLLALYDVTFKANESDGRPFDTPVELYPKVIIAGFGRFGQIVGRILRAKNIAFTALEASQTQVDFLRRFGNQVFYGDASRLELLRAAHAENAKVFVLAIDDVESSVKTAELIRKHFPHLKIFARARNRQHAFRLMDLDVRYTIRETLVSSLEMSEKILETLGLSKAKAIETVRQFRAHDELTMAKQQAVKDDESKFLETTRESAEQLLHLFETDTAQTEQSGASPTAAQTQ